MDHMTAKVSCFARAYHYNNNRISCGFEIAIHLNHEEMTEQYFLDYNNCNKTHSMKAPTGVGYVLAKKKIMKSNDSTLPET